MYNVNNTIIGETLRKYRKIKHLSLEYIGDKIGKTKATVSKYEKNEIAPDFITILELCNILDCKVEDLFPSVSSSFYPKNPFGCDKLYMYYMTEKKLISSTINIECTAGKQNSATLHNGIKETNTQQQNYAYYYEGKYEYADNVVYINLKNISSHKFEIEQVQIIIYLPLSNASTCNNCFITGLTPNLVPTIKRGIITTNPIEITKKHLEKLKISKEEIKQILADNSWNLSPKQYDEFFYDTI